MCDRKENDSLTVYPYSVYLNEREILIEAEKEGAKLFDKSILALAGGTFGLSFIFLEKIVPTINHDTIWLLILSWLLILVSILVTLVSFLTSQAGCRRQREILDKCYKLQQETTEDNGFALATNVLNIVSITFFIVGTVFLITFCGFNISKGVVIMDAKKNVPLKEGFVPQQRMVGKAQNGLVAQKPPVPIQPVKPVSSNGNKK